MSKTFGFKGVEEIMGRIQPGIEEAQITGVTDGTNDNGKYYLSIKFVTLDNNREHEERFYFTTEKGERISLQRIKSLIRELVGADKADGEYTLEQLNAMLTGKKGRFKFVGEEYEYDGDVRMRTQLAFSSFVESLKISKEDSKLKFDNTRDIKTLPNIKEATSFNGKPQTDEVKDKLEDDLF